MTGRYVATKMMRASGTVTMVKRRSQYMAASMRRSDRQRQVEVDAC